ncbi:histidine kinase [Pontibacter sp. G13]|uniref:histidine kinase n=1 Tax=Pontibacter sp. G13 TaxID=3074898 RepID=UPI00288982E8|nr:histidine kinase [Pontibacter sp. G13]WNJ20836.1 histidine kinase [Pontibacter sp. G13]
MDQSKAHILYVDDERQNLTAFKASFRKLYQVHVAQSGKDAIQLLDQHPEIELIISDQRMPEMTGVELFEQILEGHPDPIRMVMTGYSDLEAIIDAINKGQIYYYITKPWKLEELKLIVKQGIEAYRLKNENRTLHAENTDLQLKSEQQEKENILSQFETLKNQVNPHFLFNCLNALSTLVHDDANLAEDFIAKLTKVYRYVLELKDEHIVPLQEELRFLKSYFFLHQIRFGDNLQMMMKIPPEATQRSIPPLTLQLLVENAIKHNIISREQPLKLEILVEGKDLLVKNNYQIRQDHVDSTGIGLSNLKARYAFLSDRQPAFAVEGDQYVARVPLLEDQV